MRNNLLAICMSLLMSCQLFGATSLALTIEKPNNCRLSFERLYGESEKDRIERDLLSAVWTNDLDETNISTGMERVFQFNDYGILDEVTIYDDGHSYYTNHLWQLEVYNEAVFLDLYDNTLREHLLYRVEQTCEGVTLVDVATEDRIYLKYQEKQPDLYVNAIFQNFIGKWKQKTYPYELNNQLKKCGTFKEMPDAYLEFEFNRDGSYTRYMGSEMAESVEKGFWEVSSDGRYLIFHVTRDGSEEAIFTTQYAKIHSANSKGFSIEHSLTTSDISNLFCTGVKLFSFKRNYQHRSSE